MPGDRPTTGDIDRIQRVSAPPFPSAPLVQVRSVVAQARQLVRVLGVGRYEKSLDPSKRIRDAPAESVTIAAYTSQVPLAAIVLGTGREAEFVLGTWSDDGRAPVPGTATRLQTLRSLLLGAYSAVDFADLGADGVDMPKEADHGGLVLGIPHARAAPDGSLPYDRLVRGMVGQTWASLVLAVPVAEQEITTLRNSVTNEIRLFERTSASADKPDAITRYYNDLLETLLRNVSSGQSLGAWRCAVYLLGTEDSYARLSGLWRGLFSSGQAGAEPLRVWPSKSSDQAVAASRIVVELARSWALPDSPQPRPEAVGRYSAPFAYQTVLSSGQLAAYFHLPQYETPGFAVRAEPRLNFDSEPGDQAIGSKRMLALGTIATGSESQIGRPYVVPVDNLKRHAFITGVTGSGKTVTLFNLVRGLDRADVPFLVIEPTKAEYRRLAGDLEPTGSDRKPLGERIRVFTLGDERVSPFRMNPFEPGDDETQIGAHIDLLRSVFSAAFGMWNPLPQVLERCLYEIYSDRGWDFASGKNSRAGAGRPPAAFPTLTDLSAKVDDVVSNLGYAPEITSNIKAALKTRVDGLRVGGKGRMLDVPRSFPMQTLLEAPTVLELEGMGDDDDKAFLMGLFLVRLVEFRRGQMAGSDQVDKPLAHLLVIEEAHRLLTNVQASADPEQGNPRGKAVESFTNLLSEIRAYGQGVAIIDQVPVRLVPDVIKNSDLKVAHRVVAGDDREMLARTMAMDEPQSRALSRLRVGQAAVFHEGDDAPLLVAITPPQKARIAAIDLKTVMAQRRADLGLDPLLRRSAACQAVCKDLSVCDQARHLVDDPTIKQTFARAVLTLAEADEIDNEDGSLMELRGAISARMAPDSSLDVLYPSIVVHASEWFAMRRGAQWAWSFARTDELETAILTFLLEGPSQGSLERFQTAMATVHARSYPPFAACDQICDQRQPPVCMYRWSAADALPGFRPKLATALSDDKNDWQIAPFLAAEEETYAMLGTEARGKVAEPKTSARGRAALCLLQQAFEFDASLTHADARARIRDMLKKDRYPTK